LAIIGTVITTPAIIRTAMAAELHHRHGVKFKWMNRVRCFLESTGLTVVTYALSATVFALTSLGFGLICVGASFVMGTSEMASEIAFVGTASGMVWGVAGGILAFGLCIRKWQPVVLPALPKK
jgi:SNF family Na+-dependent transporter